MYRHREFFDIYPKIVRKDVPTTLTIVPKNKAKAFTAEVYFVALIPTAYQQIDFVRNWEMVDQIKVTPKDGKLTFTYSFSHQQEYHIQVYAADDTDKQNDKKAKIFEIRTTASLRIYALEEELYRRKPLVGALHLHSYLSDGEESPEYIAAQYRKAGYDFLSLSDHHTLEPSRQLIRALESVETGLALYPAEEVHGKENNIHVLNFGGQHSVNDIFNNDPDRYFREIAQLQLEWEAKLPEGTNSFRFCACLWEAEEIRKAGGLAVLAHPMERWPLQFVNEPTLDALLEHKIFDAMDICIGNLPATLRQLARWNDARAKGWNIAITAIDDCHGTIVSPDFTAGKTIVFAEENSRESIIAAIKDGYNAVVHQLQGKPQGYGPYPMTTISHKEAPHVFGTYPMVDYTQFLLEEYFPLHDEIAAAEGQRLHDYNNGDPTAAEDIARISRRAKALENKYFGR